MIKGLREAWVRRRGSAESGRIEKDYEVKEP